MCNTLNTGNILDVVSLPQIVYVNIRDIDGIRNIVGVLTIVKIQNPCSRLRVLLMFFSLITIEGSLIILVV